MTTDIPITRWQWNKINTNKACAPKNRTKKPINKQDLSAFIYSLSLFRINKRRKREVVRRYGKRKKAVFSSPFEN